MYECAPAREQDGLPEMMDKAPLTHVLKTLQSPQLPELFRILEHRR
jgi:hypothetical protein